MSESDKGLKLYILRHGQAGASMDDSAKDAARPLTAAGRKQVGEVASFLKASGAGFELIATSPLKRALQTAQIISRKYRGVKMEEWDELKATGDPNALYVKLAGRKSVSTILLVGHEPHLSGIIGEIVSGRHDVRLVLKKGGVAKLNVDQLRPKFSGDLVWLLTPKLTRKIAG